MAETWRRRMLPLAERSLSLPPAPGRRSGRHPGAGDGAVALGCSSHGGFLRSPRPDPAQRRAGAGEAYDSIAWPIRSAWCRSSRSARHWRISGATDPAAARCPTRHCHCLRSERRRSFWGRRGGYGASNNAATVSVMAPIAASFAGQLGSMIPFLMAVAISAPPETSSRRSPMVHHTGDGPVIIDSATTRGSASVLADRHRHAHPSIAWFWPIAERPSLAAARCAAPFRPAPLRTGSTDRIMYPVPHGSDRRFTMKMDILFACRAAHSILRG